MQSAPDCARQCANASTPAGRPSHPVQSVTGLGQEKYWAGGTWQTRRGERGARRCCQHRLRLLRGTPYSDRIVFVGPRFALLVFGLAPTSVQRGPVLFKCHLKPRLIEVVPERESLVIKGVI